MAEIDLSMFPDAPRAKPRKEPEPAEPQGRRDLDLSMFPDAPKRPGQTLYQAHDATVGMAPDQAAKVLDFSSRTGVDPKFVQERPDLQRAAVDPPAVDLDAYAQRHPAAARFLTSPANYAKAKDDLETLGRAERVISAWGQRHKDVIPLLGWWLQKGSDAIDYLLHGPEDKDRADARLFRSFNVGALQPTASTLDFLDRVLGIESVRPWADRLNEVLKETAVKDPTFVEKFVSGAGSMASFMAQTLATGGLAGWADAAPAVARFLALGTSVASEAMAEGGSVSRQVLEMGGTPSEAQAAGLRTALWNLPAIAITNKFGWLAETGGSLLRRVGASALTEGAQEGIQEIISDIATAKGVAPENVTFGQLMEAIDPGRVFESFLIGALLGGAAGGFTGAAELEQLQPGQVEATAEVGPPATQMNPAAEVAIKEGLEKVQVAAKAKAGAQAFVAKLEEVIGESKLAQRDLKAFEDFLDQAAQEYDLPEQVYAPARELAMAFQKAQEAGMAPMEVEDFMAEAEIPMDKFEEAVQLDLPVGIPTSLLPTLIQTPAWEDVRPALSFSPADLESLELPSLDILMQDPPRTATKEAQKFKDDLITIGGYSQEEAEVIAALVEARANRWAADTGRPPSEWFKERGLQVERPSEPAAVTEEKAPEREAEARAAEEARAQTSTYFEPTDTSKPVPLQKLEPRGTPVDTEKRARAAELMNAAEAGQGAKRKPLLAVDLGDGRHKILDGNTTLLELAERGAPAAEVEVLASPRQRTGDVEQLVAMAEPAGNELKAWMEAFAAEHGGEIYGPRIKSADSIERKLNDELNGDATRLLDVVAGTLIYDSMEDLQKAAKALGAAVERIGPMKDRFEKPIWGGYRDIATHLIMPSGLVVEVQLHLRPILEAKKSLGHQIYEVVRELGAGLIKEQGLTVEERKAAEGAIRDMGRLSNILYNNAFMQVHYPALAANSRALSLEISQDLNRILAKLSGWSRLMSLSPSIRNMRPESALTTKGSPVSEFSKKVSFSNSIDEPPSTSNIQPRRERGKPKVVVGAKDKLYRQGEAHTCHYALVEAADLLASHDPNKGFAWTKGYPKDVQERRYDLDKNEQLKVEQHAKKLTTPFVLKPSPDATNGPPIVTPDLVVLGGNSRAMSIKLAYGKYKAKGKKYKTHLARFAPTYGLSEEQVNSMKRPVLVRIVDPGTTDIQELHRWATDLNYVPTEGLGEEAEAASRGRNVSRETLERVGSLLATEDATIRKLMDKPQVARQILEWLVKDGVISQTDRAKYWNNKYKKATDAGKRAIEATLLGSVIPDAELLQVAPRWLLQQVGRNLDSLAKIQALEGGWNIAPEVREAVELLTTMDAMGFKNLGEFLRQDTLPGMKEREWSVKARALANAFLTKKPNQLRDAFKGYTQDAKMGAGGQTTLVNLDPGETFNHWFGIGSDLGPQTLFQGDAHGPKGYTRFDQDNKAVFGFLQAKDVSTAIHEIGHLLRRDLQLLAEDKYAPAQVKADWQAVKDWLGVHPGQAALTREQEEKFARGFEAYIMEGRAPSSALVRAFERLRSWLVQIYQSVKGLNVNMTQEVRAVFDRLLATDQDIRTAQAELIKPLWDIKSETAPEGIDQDAWNEYRTLAQKALDAAAAAIQAKEMEERARLEKEWRKEARDQAKNHPGQVLIRKVMDAGGLDLDELGQEYDNATMAILRQKRPGLIKRGGASPAALAAQMNMTLDQLVETLKAAPTQKELVDKYVEEQLAEWTQSWIPEDAAITTEYLDFLDHEELLLSMLSGGLGLRKLDPATVRARARQSVGQTRVQSILQDREAFKTAQAKAEREIKEARKAAKTEERARAAAKAAEAARRRREAAARRKERAEAREFLAKTARYFKRVVQAKNIDPEYLDQIRQLLASYDPAVRTPKTLARRKSLREFVEAKKAAGEAINVPDRVLDKAYQTSFSEMTMEEVQELRRAVENLEHLGKTKKRLLASKRKREIDQAVQEMVESIYANKKVKYRKTFEQATGEKGWLTKLADAGRGFKADLLKMEFIAYALDGFQENGPVYRYIFEPFKQAEDRALKLGAEIQKDLEKAFERIPKAERRKWTRKRYSIPGSKISLTREQMIMVGLNSGNKGNWTALREGFKDQGWTDETIQYVLDQLTADEWALIQDVWTTINGLYPLLDDAHYLLTGNHMVKVEGHEVKAANLPGPIMGQYFPLKFDPGLSWKAEKHQAEEAADIAGMFKNFYYPPSMAKGFTIERKGGKLPVLLNTSVITKHIHDTVLFATHAAAFRDAVILSKNPAFRQAVEDTMGREVYKQIQPWMQAIARPQQAPETYGEALVGAIRRNTTLVMLGLKATVSAKQFLSYTQTIDKLGVKAAGDGLRRFFANPWETIEFVDQRSEAMRQRRNAWDREVKVVMAQIKPGRKSARQVMGRVFMWPIGMMDAVATYPTWVAAYTKAMKDFGWNEEKAINYADRIVRTTQPTARTKDLARIQRGSEYQKLMTMFYTFFSVQFNHLWSRTAAWKEGKITTMQLARSYFWSVIIPAYLAQMIADYEPPDAKETGKALLNYIAGGIPYLRDIVNAATSGYDYTISPTAEFGRAVTRLSRSITAEEVDPVKVAKGAIEVGGYLFGIPSKQAVITMQGALDLANDETDNPLRLIFPEKKEKK